jgi:hypothetical protein
MQRLEGHYYDTLKRWTADERSTCAGKVEGLANLLASVTAQLSTDPYFDCQEKVGELKRMADSLGTYAAALRDPKSEIAPTIEHVPAGAQGVPNSVPLERFFDRLSSGTTELLANLALPAPR